MCLMLSQCLWCELVVGAGGSLACAHAVGGVSQQEVYKKRLLGEPRG